MHESKLLQSLAALAAVLALFAGVLAGATHAEAATTGGVYVDAGHGGPYSNANANGLAEKNVNLALALELKRQLETLGVRTGVDRTTDVAVGTKDIATWHWSGDLPSLYADGTTRYSSGVPLDDLQARVNKANEFGPDVFVSIHCNGVDSSAANGTETFAASFDPLGQKLAEIVQAEIIAEVGTTDRGAKEEDFYVIRWTNMPAILIEAGFITNPAEASKLGSSWWRTKFARGAARGIQKFLASSPFTRLYPRYAGTSRYDTAVAVSQAGWPYGAGTVLVASGQNWPDALAASPLSRKLDAPLLLTARDSLPGATRTELARLRPKQIVVLGSTDAVSDAVKNAAVSAAGSGASARRVGGDDRYATAALIAAEVGLPADGRVALVSGDSFVDAMSLAPFAGRWRLPVLLAGGPTLPGPTKDWLYARRNLVHGLVVVGSEGVLPSASLVGYPKPTRIAGSDRWSTNVAMLNAWGAGDIRPIVASGLDFPDGLVAGAYGAKACRPLMIVAPARLPDRTREFIARSADRIAGFGVTGSSNAIPYQMDWQLEKALD